MILNCQVVVYVDWVLSMLDEESLTVDDNGDEEDADYQLNQLLNKSEPIRAKLFRMPLKEFREQLMTQAKYLILGSARDMENRTKYPKLLEKAAFIADGVVIQSFQLINSINSTN